MTFTPQSEGLPTGVIPSEYTLRWGVLGCGDVVERKCGPALQAASGSDIVAVMRRDAAEAQAFAARNGIARWYADADALIADPDVDVVYIATWPDTHSDYVVRCAEAGKSVCVEKPMGRNPVESRRALEACERAGVGLWVSYYRRAHPLFEKARELVWSGAIGTPRRVHMKLRRPVPLSADGGVPWRLRPEISGGGRFVDLGCHMLDWLDHAFGPLRCLESSARSRGEGYTAEDVVRASFQTERGVAIEGDWWFCGPESVWHDETRIEGDKGAISFPFFRPGPLVLERSEGRVEHNIASPEPITMPFIQSLVDQITGKGTCHSTGVSALRTDVVIDEILRTGGLRR